MNPVLSVKKLKKVYGKKKPFVAVDEISFDTEAGRDSGPSGAERLWQNNDDPDASGRVDAELRRDPLLRKRFSALSL